MRKVIVRICNVVSTLILIGAVLVCLALLAPKALGYDMYSVLSGSMEPTYHVGSVVYINTKVEAKDIKEGDPIAFYKSPGVVATHRAIKVDLEKQEFTTKGDANRVTDADPIAFSQLIGKAVFTIPILGYVSIYIRTTKGIMIASILIMIVILTYALPGLLEQKKGGEEHEAE